jgi:PAS domain S-box-containing protein
MKTRVLLVEDNRDDVELTLTFCADAAPQLEFTVVATGAECQAALAAARERPFDALVLDYTLPDMDGLTLLRAIVDMDYPAPVVIVTGRNTVETAVEAMKAGAMDYLVKSSDHWEHVPRVIAAAITRYHLSRENQRLQAELQVHATELEQAVRQSEREKARLRAVIDQLPEGVVIFDGQVGRTVAANRAAEQLWGHAFIPDVSIPEYARNYRMENLDGTLREPENTVAARVLATGQPILSEQMTIVRPDESRITVLVNGAPLLDEQRDVTGAVVVFQDISEMKQLEYLRDEILSIASHELKNPLTVIAGYSSLLSRSAVVERDDRAQRAAATIRQQAARMRRLIDRLLDLSRLDLGRMVLQKSTFDLALLVRTVTEQQQELSNNHTLQLHLEHENLFIEGDYTRLEQVLINLVGNAIKYSPEGGDIGLTLRIQREVNMPNAVCGSAIPDTGPFALVQVHDYGIGIDGDAQKQLFTRFYRTKEAAHIATGQGLGLYISAEIVRMHGGVLCAESRPEDGTTFSMVLPILPEE